MSDIALNRPAAPYRAGRYASANPPRGQPPERLGSPAGRNRFPETEHPVWQPGDCDPLEVRDGNVLFRESGLLPLEDNLTPEWYRKIEGPLRTLNPTTVGGLPGVYLRPTGMVGQTEILLVGVPGSYRLYLYLGWASWYPLWVDCPVIKRTQNGRNMLAGLLWTLKLWSSDILTVGCAIRACVTLARGSVNRLDVYKSPFAKMLDAAFYGDRWIRYLSNALSGATPLEPLDQLIAGGPFSFALAEQVLSHPERLAIALQDAGITAYDQPLLESLVAANDSADEEDEMGEEYHQMLLEDGVLVAGETGSNRRVILFDDERKNESES